MSSSLKINFCDQYLIDCRRTDPMRPMDLGDGPEILELKVTIPRHVSEVTWDPFFGTCSHYTGYLSDGRSSRPVFIKWSKSVKRMKELKEEGDFYCSALRKLQGVVVPNFYGYYAAIGENMCGVGCMILEKMDGGGISSWEIGDRLKLEAVYRLHKFGICHRVLDEEDNFVMHGDRIYVVDFAMAYARCGCEMTKDRVRLCAEAKLMEQAFGDGETNSVLKEIGVPPGWRVCLNQTTRVSEESQKRALFTDLYYS